MPQFLFCLLFLFEVEEIDLEKQLMELVPVKVKLAYINSSPDFIFCCFAYCECRGGIPHTPVSWEFSFSIGGLQREHPRLEVVVVFLKTCFVSWFSFDGRSQQMS